MVEHVVHYNPTSATGVENVKVSIFDTWATIVGSRECMSVKRGGVDWFVFATSALIDNTIFEGQVADVFGYTWTCVFVSIDKGVVSWVAKIELHPFSSWVVIIHRHFCLYLDVNGDAL